MVDKQIYNSLEHIHKQYVGKTSAGCWWHYDGGRDIYSCPHLTLQGKEVIARVQTINHFIKKGVTRCQMKFQR